MEKAVFRACSKHVTYMYNWKWAYNTHGPLADDDLTFFSLFQRSGTSGCSDSRARGKNSITEKLFAPSVHAPNIKRLHRPAEQQSPTNGGPPKNKSNYRHYSRLN